MSKGAAACVSGAKHNRPNRRGSIHQQVSIHNDRRQALQCKRRSAAVVSLAGAVRRHRITCNRRTFIITRRHNTAGMLVAATGTPIAKASDAVARNRARARARAHHAKTTSAVSARRHLPHDRRHRRLLRRRLLLLHGAAETANARRSTSTRDFSMNRQAASASPRSAMTSACSQIGCLNLIAIRCAIAVSRSSSPKTSVVCGSDSPSRRDG